MHYVARDASKKTVPRTIWTVLEDDHYGAIM